MIPEKISTLASLILAILIAISVGRIVIHPTHAASPLQEGARSVPASHYHAGGPLGIVLSKVPPSPYVPGVAAIVPHASAVAASGARITTDEVRNYLITQNLLTPVSGTTPSIIQIQFLPSSQVRPLLGGDPTGRPDTDLLCYVEVQGPINLGFVSVPQGLHLANFHKGVVVFDAQTGNLLIEANF